MIKNIVFDFGGVIAEMTRENSVKAFADLGLPDADSRLDKYHQTGIFQELEEGRLSADGFRREIASLCGHDVTMDEVRYAWRRFFSDADMRKLEYLDELRKKYRVYLLSNTNPFVMSWACSVGFSPAGRPLTDYFDKLYLSYEIGHTKPVREIFDYMIADSGVVPEETVFVDDGTSNIETGRSVGFVTLQPDNGEDWRDDLTALLNGING